jgi:hypothetical protein
MFDISILLDFFKKDDYLSTFFIDTRRLGYIVVAPKNNDMQGSIYIQYSRDGICTLSGDNEECRRYGDIELLLKDVKEILDYQVINVKKLTEFQKVAHQTEEMELSKIGPYWMDNAPKLGADW